MQAGNVTADDFKAYLVEFHRVLEQTARQYLPPGHQRKLVHTVALPCRVVGYVSTQFGVAVDYDPPVQRTGEERTTIDVITGSKRIESLVLHEAGAPASMLRAAPAVAGIDHIHFIGIAFGGRVELRDERSSGVFDRCYFFWPPDQSRKGSPQWHLGTAYLEMFGDRSRSRWTIDGARAAATKEVLAALYELQRAERAGLSLVEYHQRIRERTVLMLGSFSEEGRRRLALIATSLRSLGYEPVTVEDVPDVMPQTVAQKVGMLGHLARFVVVDDSEKSGHLREVEICKANDWVTVLMRIDGVPSSGMTRGLDLFSKVIREQPYTEESVGDAVRSSADWAERLIAQLRIQLRKAYPWVESAVSPPPEAQPPT